MVANKSGTAVFAAVGGTEVGDWLDGAVVGSGVAAGPQALSMNAAAIITARKVYSFFMRFLLLLRNYMLRSNHRITEKASPSGEHLLQVGE
jgi:hypothetical protein